MSVAKPFYRTYRPPAPGREQVVFERLYIQDIEFAVAPQQYVRAFLLIQQDFLKLFEYIEPGEESRKTFSLRIHELFMRTCIEIEANFKEILRANGYKRAIRKENLNVHDYWKVNKSHHLSSYMVLVPLWGGKGELFGPYESWSTSHTLPWYQDYQKSKHDRVAGFKLANLENLTSAISALVILLTSQFKGMDFTSGSSLISLSSYDYYEHTSAIGDFFRIKYASDWTAEERYDFDWSVLKLTSDRFQKFDYDAI